MCLCFGIAKAFVFYKYCHRCSNHVIHLVDEYVFKHQVAHIFIICDLPVSTF